jgi:thioredoxin-dependent peroxiredoxin
MSKQIGDLAPDFTLNDQEGKKVCLYDLLSQKPVVLFFYPKDNTPGCTKEACTFRDRYSVFQEMGAEVLGISSDSVTSHQQFANTHHLPFQLLSDPENQVRRLFGVPSTLWILPGRVTYLIDNIGKIRYMFDSQLDFEGHIEGTLKALQEFKTE